MAFSRLLKQTASISRLQSGVGVQKTYVLVAGNIKCSIQPMTAEQNALHGLAMGKGYKMFYDAVAVQAGDKVIDDATGEEFRVQGVESYLTMGTGLPHESAVLAKEDS